MVTQRAITSASGHRQYPQDIVRRIRFIELAKELGFSLKEVADIDATIRDLARMKEALMALTATCSGRGPTSECPGLGALKHQEAPGS